MYFRLTEWENMDVITAFWVMFVWMFTPVIWRVIHVNSQLPQHVTCSDISINQYKYNRTTYETPTTEHSLAVHLAYILNYPAHKIQQPNPMHTNPTHHNQYTGNKAWTWWFDNSDLQKQHEQEPTSMTYLFMIWYKLSMVYVLVCHFNNYILSNKQINFSGVCWRFTRHVQFELTVCV